MPADGRARVTLAVALAAAAAVFCVVQDRVTAAGARRYVTAQRAALAARGPAVTIEDIMTPAIRDSVLWGGASAGAMAAAGLAVAAAFGRGRRP